jgi:hypothetical protein
MVFKDTTKNIDVSKWVLEPKNRKEVFSNKKRAHSEPQNKN